MIKFGKEEKMKLVDTHCHLDNNRYSEDLEEILDTVQKKMEFCVNIGCDLESSKRSIELAENNSNIYATVGIHPIDILEFSEETKIKIEELASNKKVVAIGEIGLDYYHMSAPKELQILGFEKQLEIAKKLNKPVVIHSRDAISDTVEILNRYKEIKGVIHCYSGSLETAKTLIDRFYIGISGTVTFKNAKKLIEVVKEIPLERIVIETDSPYLAPEPFRGKRNQPDYVEYVAKKIAEIKGIEMEQVIRVTTENAKKLYNI